MIYSALIALLVSENVYVCLKSDILPSQIILDIFLYDRKDH